MFTPFYWGRENKLQKDQQHLRQTFPHSAAHLYSDQANPLMGFHVILERATSRLGASYHNQYFATADPFADMFLSLLVSISPLTPPVLRVL